MAGSVADGFHGTPQAGRARAYRFGKRGEEGTMKLSVAVAAAVVGASIPLIACAEKAKVPVMAPSVKGTFESKGVSFPVRGVYAYRTTQSFGKETIVNVVVSNAEILAPGFDRWLDRRKAIGKTFEDAETAVVNFEFSLAGEFGGVSYDFGSSNFCGISRDFGMKSTVKLADGRLTGVLSHRAEKLAWDISFDVPIASDDHGRELPAGGREPGKAYLSYAAALKAGDAAALRKVLSPFLSEKLTRAEKDGNVGGFLAWLNEDRVVDTVSVEKGFATRSTRSWSSAAPEVRAGARARPFSKGARRAGTSSRSTWTTTSSSLAPSS
jgi:hypothetical protein